MSTTSLVDSAVRFLLTSQHAVGFWADFRLAPGQSSAWVTAYVGLALALQDDPKAKQAAFNAWDWLAGWEKEGWGYNIITPHDADSTLWALKLAEAVGQGSSKAAQRGYEFLAQHSKPNGGVATYASDKEIRRFINAPPTMSFDGWCEPQACVTAAAARLQRLAPGARDFLRAAQSPDGRWRSYWWCEDEYATALAAEALSQQKTSEDAERIERAVKWAASRVSPDGSVSSFLRPSGSPFATAWVIRLLALSDEPDLVRDPRKRALGWLQSQQQADGSWPPSAGLRVPPPPLRDPETYSDWVVGKQIEGGISMDQSGLFTTATVINALRTN